MNTLQVTSAGHEDIRDLADPQDLLLGEHQWRLTIDVNGQTRTFRRDNVKDGQTFPLGFDFTVDIPDDSATITISSSGTEDQNITDDDLPTAERTHGSADSFGIGSSFQIQGSDSDYSYTVGYTISCLSQESQSLIQRASVSKFVNGLFNAWDRPAVSDDVAVAFFVGKMQKRGLRLHQVSADLLVFEGTRSVTQTARDTFRFPKDRGAPKK